MACQAHAQHHSRTLMAWLLLVLRYADSAHDLDPAALAQACGATERTLQRWVRHGIFLLTDQLADAEHRARVARHRAQLYALLPSASSLVGRHRLQGALWQALWHQRTSCLVLHGPEGVGKTALAVWLAHCVLQQDAEAVVVWLAQPSAWDDVQRSLDAALRPLRLALGTHNTPHADKRVILVLDACDALCGWPPDDLRALVQCSQSVQLVLTLRQPCPQQLDAVSVSMRLCRPPWTTWCAQTHCGVGGLCD